MRIATFYGTLGRDWEKKEVSGYDIFENSLAVKCGKGNKDTMWVKLTQWGDKQGQTLEQYTGKGCKMIVSGDIEARAWVKDGEAKCQIEINVSKFSIVTFKEDGKEEVPDEIPF